MKNVVLKKDFLNNKKGSIIQVSEQRRQYLIRVGVIGDHNDVVLQKAVNLFETKKRGRKSKK